MSSYRLSKGKHINLLELERSLISLRRITREGVRARRLLVPVDSLVVFKHRLERTTELTKSQLPASKTEVLVHCL